MIFRCQRTKGERVGDLKHFFFLKSKISLKDRNKFRYFCLLEMGCNCSYSVLDVQMTQIC